MCFSLTPLTPKTAHTMFEDRVALKKNPPVPPLRKGGWRGDLAGLTAQVNNMGLGTWSLEDVGSTWFGSAHPR